MKNLVYISFLTFVFSVNSQNRQREITDFIEKWTLEVSDMEELEINSLPGNIKIIGTDETIFSIKAIGPDTYKLSGGVTELGFLLTKNKRGFYRIQGIMDNSKEFNVTYEIHVPNSVELKVHSGSRYLDNNYWNISNMESALQISKIKGAILLNDVQNTVTALNMDGGINIHFLKLIHDKPYSIAATGNIMLNIPSEAKASLQIHLYRDLNINSDKALKGKSIDLKKGVNSLKKGKYFFDLNDGGVSFFVHAYEESINFKFY